MMNIVNNKMFFLGLFIAQIATAHSIHLHDLSAQEIQMQHDETLKEYDRWLERKKDAIPRILMKQQRIEAEKNVQHKSTKLDYIARQLALKEEARNRLNGEIAELHRQKQYAEEDLQHAIKNSNDWKQRSNSEKVEAKVNNLLAQLHALQAAFAQKPWIERHHHPLSRYV